MSYNFYRAFEDLHRGSRELITTRLKIYLPFVEPLKNLYPNSQAIDLGCGRGEWLELLQENGFDIQGVDLDETMLFSCRQLNLKVTLKDALQALKELPDESQILVSGFHLIEHIHFEELQTLVKESFRVLRPAGLLILETPNPENIIVASVNFYLDPTHLKPLPPQLLEFLTRHHKFSRIKILRLQETIDLQNSKRIGLHEILGGISPDYAVIAQKDAEEAKLKPLNYAFSKEYGVTLNQAVDLYQTQQEDLKLKQAELFQYQIDKLYMDFSLLSQRLLVLERIFSPLIWTYSQLRLVRRQGIRFYFINNFGIYLKMIYRSLNEYLKNFPRIYLICLKTAYLIRLNILKNYLSKKFSIQENNKVFHAQNLVEELPAATKEIYQQLDIALTNKNKT